MRNPVAHNGVHTVRSLATGVGRALMVLAAVSAALVTVAAQAGADVVAVEGVTAEASSVVTPVGIAAVIFGVGGLVVGLLRRRRITTSRAAAVTAPMEAVRVSAEPARGDAA